MFVNKFQNFKLKRIITNLIFKKQIKFFLFFDSFKCLQFLKMVIIYFINCADGGMVYAEVCKIFYAGSIPAQRSKKFKINCLQILKND